MPVDDVQRLKLSAHPLTLIALLSQRKRGKLSPVAFSKRMQFEQSKDISIFYAGYAIRFRSYGIVYEHKQPERSYIRHF